MTRIPARTTMALLVALVLAGCSSMGGISPAGGGNAGGARVIDTVADPLDTLVFVFDLPDAVHPTEAGATVTYNVNVEGAPAYLDTPLERADAELAMAALSPPDAGRSYHVYMLPRAAQEKLRALQAFARKLPSRPSPRFAIVPRLCLAAPADKARATVTVKAVLPGRGALAPLLVAEPLTNLELRSSPIGDCG